jgi:hypothetical protein
MSEPGWLTHWAHQAEAATEGKWEVYEFSDGSNLGIDAGGGVYSVVIGGDSSSGIERRADAEFIAASRSVAGPILELVQRAEAALSQSSLLWDHSDLLEVKNALLEELRRALGSVPPTGEEPNP